MFRNRKDKSSQAPTVNRFNRPWMASNRASNPLHHIQIPSSTASQISTGGTHGTAARACDSMTIPQHISFSRPTPPTAGVPPSSSYPLPPWSQSISQPPPDTSTAHDTPFPLNPQPSSQVYPSSILYPVPLQCPVNNNSNNVIGLPSTMPNRNQNHSQPAHTAARLLEEMQGVKQQPSLNPKSTQDHETTALPAITLETILQKLDTLESHQHAIEKAIDTSNLRRIQENEEMHANQNNTQQLEQRILDALHPRLTAMQRSIEECIVAKKAKLNVQDMAVQTVSAKNTTVKVTNHAYHRRHQEPTNRGIASNTHPRYPSSRSSDREMDVMDDGDEDEAVDDAFRLRLARRVHRHREKVGILLKSGRVGITPYPPTQCIQEDHSERALQNEP